MAETVPMPIDCVSMLADTGHLSDGEMGLYARLLMHLWRSPNMRFPNDEEWMARKFRLTVDDVKTKLRPVLADFFISDGSELELGEIGNRHIDASKHPSRLLGASYRILRPVVFSRDGNVCAYCGSLDGPFEVDHVRPRSRGGEHHLDNLTVACRPCNRSKRDRTVAEWLENANG
jgi:hypothetical protein